MAGRATTGLREVLRRLRSTPTSSGKRREAQAPPPPHDAVTTVLPRTARPNARSSPGNATHADGRRPPRRAAEQAWHRRSRPPPAMAGAGTRVQQQEDAFGHTERCGQRTTTGTLGYPAPADGRSRTRWSWSTSNPQPSGDGARAVHAGRCVGRTTRVVPRGRLVGEDAQPSGSVAQTTLQGSDSRWRHPHRRTRTPHGSGHAQGSPRVCPDDVGRHDHLGGRETGAREPQESHEAEMGRQRCIDDSDSPAEQGLEVASPIPGRGANGKGASAHGDVRAAAAGGNALEGACIGEEARRRSRHVASVR